ncbi:hypothetical protein [Microbacterium plantarum]|uniref:hypothetical protein n=1 Tax=Microbacterium plantarum TaxID=1816425 RepID=UPI002B460F15|nr:hypothetical protein [Microbacterium plantarum]WRK17546.1 hypothetical protein VC184_00615 [Microbacterium plantarum]
MAPTAATAASGETPSTTTTTATAAFTSAPVTAVIRFVPSRCSAWNAPLKTKPIGVSTVAGMVAIQYAAKNPPASERESTGLSKAIAIDASSRSIAAPTAPVSSPSRERPAVRARMVVTTKPDATTVTIAAVELPRPIAACTSSE